MMDTRPTHTDTLKQIADRLRAIGPCAVAGESSATLRERLDLMAQFIDLVEATPRGKRHDLFQTFRTMLET
jgi:hypothetical protein